MMFKRCLIFAAVLVLATTAWAEPANESRKTNASIDPSSSSYSGSSSDVGWNGWGLRAGLSSDFDQFVGGAHFNLGEVLRHVRLQPDVQLGAGDNATTLYGTAPLYYRFDTARRMTPYAGGGVALGWVDVDVDTPTVSQSESSVEVGAKATGGLEWPRRGSQAFFVELSLGFGDVPDATVLAAWTF